MFEDSTFESNGTIRTRSRGWMIATCAFNGSILLALVLIPLIYPEALPRMAISFLMEVPPPPVPEPKPVAQPAHAVVVQPQMQGGEVFAPRVIPPTILIAQRQEVLPVINPANMDTGTGPGSTSNPFGSANPRPVVRPRVSGPVRVSGMIEQGLLLDKRMPVYPAIAKATGTQGTVILEAMISRTGTIENLHVVSGPALLQQAAIDAVKMWRYRPYLLSGDPVEVETSVNVVFKLQN